MIQGSVLEFRVSITATCQGGGAADVGRRGNNQIRTRNGRNGRRGKQEKKRLWRRASVLRRGEFVVDPTRWVASGPVIGGLVSVFTAVSGNVTVVVT